VNRNPAVRLALGSILRSFREGRDLSQEALANAADIDRTYVGSVERGDRNVSFENLWMLLHALGVSWSDLGRELDRHPAFHKAPVTRSQTGSGAVRRRRGA